MGTNRCTLHPDTRNETRVGMLTALVAGVILAGVLYACFLIGQGNVRANLTNPTTQTDTATTQEITQP